MEMSVIIAQMIKFFIMMSVGYGLFKIGIMDSDFNKKVTNLILRVTMPCMIVASVFNVSEDRDFKKVFFVFGLAIATYILLPIIGMIITKIIRCKKEETGIYVFMTIFTNTGFMGFPVVESMLGSEALFYAAIFNMIFNIMLFTVGVKAINYPNGEKSDSSVKKIITHPGVLSALIALVLYFINIPLHPSITGAIDSIGDVTSPVAMLLMGASLAKVPVKKVFNDARIYIFVIIKQVLLPIVTYIVLKQFVTDIQILLVAFVMIAMPIANTSVMFAIEYDKDEELAAKAVFISTLASVVLFPLVLYLMYFR